MTDQAEDEGIPRPDPETNPPGVDADLEQEGVILPGDRPRAAGRRGETVAEQRAGGGAESGPEEAPGSSAAGQLTEDELDPAAVDLVGDGSGLGPEERAISVVEEPGPRRG